MNMKQNAALEMFEYLKEHLIPLAKDKGDKVYESDTTVQIAQPENKSVWDCEKEVKQLLSKIGAYSASVKNSINCVIINYSQTAQAVYIGFFVADRVTYEYIEERSFNTFIKNEKRIRGFSYSKDGILYGHSTPRAKPKEFNPSFSMYFATKETKHWPCTMKDLFSIHTYDGLFESVVYFIMLFFGETNPLWKDLAKDYTEQSAYSAIPLTVIDESHSRRELIAKYYGEDTEQILYSIVPEDAFIDGISFQSENPEVATIDENGTLTAVASGSTTITVTAGDVSAACKVIVQQNMKAEGPMPGRIVIPELNINTGLIYGCTQEITDAADSAAIWETGQGITVADHWNQGNYTNIQYSVPGSTIAYIDGTKYICTEYFKGHNTGTCIVDNAGNDVMNTLGAGKALLYTCNGCWQNVHVAIYQMAAN